MTRFIVLLCLLLGCSTPEQPYKTIYMQLEDAQIAAREKTQNIIDCLHRIHKRDTLKSDTVFTDLYRRLTKITTVRDSLIHTLPVATNSQFIENLEKFKTVIIGIHYPTYTPKEHFESNFIIELDILKKELHLLPSEIHEELFKAIVERWTDECFSSLLQHWAIDDPC